MTTTNNTTTKGAYYICAEAVKNNTLHEVPTEILTNKDVRATADYLYHNAEMCSSYATALAKQRAIVTVTIAIENELKRRAS